MLLIDLDPEDAESAQDLDDNTSDNYNRMEMPFNNLMREFFEGSDINDLIQHILAHIKTQVENPQMHESGFTLDKKMHLHLCRLVLTREGSYTELPKWIKSKRQ